MCSDETKQNAPVRETMQPLFQQQDLGEHAACGLSNVRTPRAQSNGDSCLEVAG